MLQSTDENFPQHFKYLQNEDDLLAKLRGFFIEAEEARKKKEHGWKSFRKLFDGKESGEFSNVEAINKEKTIRNHVTAVVRQLSSTLMDNRPKMHVLARNPQLEDAALGLTSLLEKIWYDIQFNILMVAVLCDVLIEGTGIAKTFYDANLDNVNAKGVAALDFYADPYGGLFLDNHRYVIERVYYDDDEIYELYPDYADKLSPIDENDDKSKSETRKGIIEKLSSVFKSPESTGLRKTHQRQRYALLEFWFRDPAIVDNIRLYPNGRRILTDESIQYVLENTANPFEETSGGHGMFPYIIFRDYIQTNEFWGTGEVKDIKNLQELSDKLLEQVVASAELSADNVLLAEEGALSFPVNQLEMRSGDILSIKPGRMEGIQRLEGAPLPTDIFNLILDNERFVELQTGASRAARGQTPTGEAQSGRAILALQQASDRRVRRKVQLLETSWQRLGEQWLGLIQQFYPINRQINASDEHGQSLVIIKDEHLTNIFDIKIQPDSSLPIDKASIFQRLIELTTILSQMGLPPSTQIIGAILKYSDVPNWQQLAQEVTAQMGMIQQMAAGGINPSQAVSEDIPQAMQNNNQL